MPLETNPFNYRKFIIMLRTILIGLFLLNLASDAKSQDASSDAMTLELTAMAKDFASIIEKKGGGAVAIGEFSASSDVKASVGPQIQLVLAKALNTLTDAKGRPLVPLKNSEVYGVRLINKAPFEVAVDLRIDGINIFEFSETSSKFYLIAAGKHVDVLGWHKTAKKSIEFKVGDFPDTAASKLNLKPSSSIGQITACFSASWDDESKCPKDEPLL